MATQYDVVVIGSGPGGYVAAIRSAQLGLKTAIVERYPTLGGTCLNVGCIPSKALLDSSHHYHDAAHKFADHGIGLDNLRIDMAQMQKRRGSVVQQNVSGVAFLMKKNKIDVHAGHGSFTGPNELVVKGDKGAGAEVATLSFKQAIIATGSKPTKLKGVEVDKKRIITSTEALELTEVPKNLLVIGAGIIGLEIGSVYARLGSKVTVIEYLDRAVAAMDGSIGKEMERILRKELKFEFAYSHKVTGASTKKNAVTVTAQDKDGKDVTFEGDYCLVAVGRSSYTEGLNLEAAGVKADERGRIATDEYLRTNVPHIYAIGDVVKGAMLAHKASEEGVFVAETIAGQHPHINYWNIPSVLYTWPEAASVGRTEEQLKEAGIPYKVGKFDMRNIGRSRASGDIDGFVKILAHKDTDEILGMHILGARAADLIAEAVVALEFRASAEDLGIFSHAHPTYAEAIKEAALDATGKRSLHM